MSVLQRWVIHSSEPFGLPLEAVERADRRAGRARAVGVVLAAVAGQANPRLVAAMGQPRCMHRLENTTNIASWACQSEFLLPV